MQIAITALGEMLTAMVGMPDKVSIMITGQPGIGKSAVVAAAAEAAGGRIWEVRLSQCTETDLLGLPMIDSAAGVSRWLPPAFLPAGIDVTGILFLDELPLASADVQASAMQLVLDRRCGSYTVPDGVLIVAAGNRAEDRAGVSGRRNTALEGRFCHIELLPPRPEAWCLWAAAEGLDAAIVAYISARPAALLDWSPGCASAAQPTPRTWHMASRMLLALPPSCAAAAVAGCVGDAAAAEFFAWLPMRSLPSLADVLAGRAQAPKLPSVAAAAADAVRRWASEIASGSIVVSTLGRNNLVLYAVSLPIEPATIAVEALVAMDSSLARMPELQAWFESHRGTVGK